MFDKLLLLTKAKDALQNAILEAALIELDNANPAAESTLDLGQILSDLNSLSPSKAADLRSLLTKKMDNPTLKHALLLAISSAYPINATDFTLEDIDEQDKIVTSDGYQFNSASLFTWINEKKKMINPYTNLEFSAEDQVNIKAYAELKKVELKEPDSENESTAELNGLDLLALLLMLRNRENRVPSSRATSSSATIIEIDASDLLPFLSESMGRSQANTASSSAGSTPRAESFSASHPYNLMSSLFANVHYMDKVVTALETRGLTMKILTDNWRNTRQFGQADKAAMLYLVTGKISKYLRNAPAYMRPGPLLTSERLTPLQAISEINLLSKAQLIALQVLYSAGLRGDHLRQFDSRRGNFDADHTIALMHYIKEEGYLPYEAMDKINGLPGSEVEAQLSVHIAQQQRFRP